MSCGCDIGPSTTHIVPVAVGDEDAALRQSQELFDRGIAVPAIRPPTVPRGTARLRFSLSAAHDPNDLDRTLSILHKVLGKGT